MSRSGYIDDYDDQWGWIRWRGAVASAIKGARGQAFLREMLSAMDALSEHKLIANDLERDGAVCALGAVGKARGIAMAEINHEDAQSVASAFGMSHALAAEIEFMNDEIFDASDELRFARMRKWIESLIAAAPYHSAGPRTNAPVQ